MLKYTGKYWMFLAPQVKKSLRRHYGKRFAEQTMLSAKPIYRNMLSRMDDIGADNPMASNVYMSFVFFAVYQAANGKITIKGKGSTKIVAVFGGTTLKTGTKKKYKTNLKVKLS